MELSTPIIMAAIFFSRTGIKLSAILKEKKTATSTWYKDSCLDPLLQQWEKEHPKSGLKYLKLHHDNAPVHSSALITGFLKTRKVDLLPHPPYSPDLAPCDFWLFPKLKQKLKGKRYTSTNELIQDWETNLNNLTTSDFKVAFQEWIKRCQMVLLKNGDYI